MLSMISKARALTCLVAAACGALCSRVSVVPRAPPPISVPSVASPCNAGVVKQIPSRYAERVGLPIVAGGVHAGGDRVAGRMPMVAPGNPGDARSVEAKLTEIVRRREETDDAVAQDEPRADPRSSSNGRTQRRSLLTAMFGSSAWSLTKPAIAEETSKEEPIKEQKPLPKKEEPKKEEKPPPKKEEPKKEEAPAPKPAPKKEEPNKEEKPPPKKEEPKKEDKPPPKKEEPKKEPAPAPKPAPKKEAKKELTKQEKKELAELSEKNLFVRLPKQIDEMRDKREEIVNKIKEEENVKAEVKAKLQKIVANTNDRLAKMDASITKREKMRDELDEDISEAENKLFKILESSAALLNSLKSKRGD